MAQTPQPASSGTSARSPGCRISAHRWSLSENRSLPSLNSSDFSHRRSALTPTWTHMTTRTLRRTDMQDEGSYLAGGGGRGGGRRGYSRDIPGSVSLFPGQTSHAKSRGSNRRRRQVTPRQCFSVLDEMSVRRVLGDTTRCLERRSVPRPLSGLFRSMGGKKGLERSLCDSWLGE